MRKLFGNFSWILSGSISATILRATTLLLLVRLSSAEDFAIYAAVYGFLVFGKALSDLGLTKLITRERSLQSRSDHYLHALKLNSLTSTILGFIGTIALILAALFGMPLFWCLVPTAIAMACEKNADTWQAIHLADGSSHLVAFFTFMRRIVTLTSFIFLAFFEILNPILSMALAELLGAFLSVVFVRRSVGRTVNLPKTLDFWPTIRESRPYWVHGLAMHARNLDVTIVAFFAPVAQSGYFAAATRLSGPLQLIPSTLASVLLPHTARNRDSEKGGVNTIILLTTLLFIPLTILLALSMPTVGPFLIGEEYSPAILCIQIIILGLPLSVFSNLTSAALQGQGFAREISRVSWVYGFFLLAAVAMGAYLNGAVGAALGTVLANTLLVALILTIWLKK